MPAPFFMNLWKGYALDFAGRYVGSSTRTNANALFLQEMVLKHMEQSLQLHLDCTIYHVTLVRDVPTKLQLSKGVGFANNYTSATSAHWQQIPGTLSLNAVGAETLSLRWGLPWTERLWGASGILAWFLQHSRWSHSNQAQLLWTFALSQLSLMQEYPLQPVLCNLQSQNVQ